MRRFSLALSYCLIAATSAAQDAGTLQPKPLPPLENPGDPKLAAKQVFGRLMTPVEAESRSIGFYSRGCQTGAQALPLDGESWKVMRVSRNRYWGQPETIAFLERFSKKASEAGIWPGILVGDISQPRGGPMLTGHASHQIGLDADIWLTPMPESLTRAEREEMSAVDMVRSDGLDVNENWSEKQAGLIRQAAQEPQVSMIFVNAAIKKALCERHAGEPWMTKVRPWWGHNYHFHVRLRCPADAEACENQGPPPPGDGCDKSLTWWFSDEALHPKPSKTKKPAQPLTMAQLPAACRAVAAQK